MQLKNNEKRNYQFFFNKKDKSGKVSVEFVHIPGGATVELDDNIFDAICASKTEVAEMEERIIPLNEEQVGAEIRAGREVAVVKEYFPTGKTRLVSLVGELIKQGKLTVVERVKVTMKEVEALLVSNGVKIEGMADDAKLALYDKLV